MIRTALAALLVAAAMPAASQTTAAPTTGLTAEEQAEMEQLRAQLAAGKREIVRQNLELTDAEAAKFWPRYEKYQAELQGFNRRIGDGVDRYASAYNSGSVNDAQAKTLGTEMLKLEADELKAKQKMFADVSKILPAKKATRYMQIENKVRALIRYEMAADIPLVN